MTEDVRHTVMRDERSRISAHISLQSVRKAFGSADGEQVLAVDSLSLEIKAGQFITLLGPSGCGKTTILNIIAGFERPTSGQVVLNGRQVTGPGPDRGVVFQDYALFPWLSVLDNVTYGLRERGVAPAERQEIATRFLRMAGLAGFENRYPHELSGGMRQRVGLVRVLANDAAVLLMDEPFASVDAQTRRFLQREIEHMWLQVPKTVVFVTHSVEEAIYLGDVVVVMTARPGHTKEIIAVTLERPRDVTSVAFNALRRQAELAVEEEAKKMLVAQGIVSDVAGGGPHDV